MGDRVRSMKRVLAVQKQMVQLAEWRLSVAKRQTVELKADEQRLQTFIAGDQKLSPLLSDAAFRRGKSLQTAIVRSEASAMAHSNHTDTMRRREKLAEKLVRKLSDVADHEAEKRGLEETIQAAAWKDDASFP